MLNRYVNSINISSTKYTTTSMKIIGLEYKLHEIPYNIKYII